MARKNYTYSIIGFFISFQLCLHAGNNEGQTLEILDTLSEIPPGVMLTYNKEAGFYTTAFDLTLSLSDASFIIAYTIDGSNPATSSSASESSSPVTIQIDPASTTGRAATPGFIVRACIKKEGYRSSFPVAETFIFTDKVKTQVYPGSPWPSSDVNGQILDYDMASDVTTDGRYSGLIDDALLDIPSISVTTDNANLFDASTGIYVNASERDLESERECSVELINPDGSKGFQINAGLRIRGGSSRSDDNPKHSFRLFFRSEYGAEKLEYPLFGNEGVSEFDNIDLRTEQNYSWSKDGSEHNTFVKDLYSRNAQGKTSQPYARGRYYHLYLNGMYWGLYQTQERPEASYAKSYFGGDKEDYDVIKVSPIGWPFHDEATDGTMDSWKELWDLCRTGFSSNASYYGLEGKNEYGKPVKGSRVLVDIDNLIDYMVMIFYTGNFDGPVSAWYNNSMPNNFYAIYSKKNKGLGYKFIAHDAEHTMFIDPIYVGTGIEENRVNIGDIDGYMKMVIDNVIDFNPQWLHYKLCANSEYRTRFANRAYKQLSNGGVFCPDTASEQFQALAIEINMAIIAESARWGDAQTLDSRTKDDDWLPEINAIMDDFFPKRTDIVIDQLIDADLYPTLEAPKITKSGTAIYSSNFSFSGLFTLNISNPNAEGDIYYTLDGSDPRISGGGVSSEAISSAMAFDLSIAGSTVIKARIKSGSLWSALKEVNFLSENEDYTTLKVTEIFYHPKDEIIGTDTTDGKSFEFLELKNAGTSALNISGIKIDSAIHYIVPENTILSPKGFYVIAAKPAQFYARYGVNPSGNYSGNFANSGEYVLIEDRTGNEIISFTYDDQSPWPLSADGDGYSLVPVHINPVTDPNNPEYWRVSLFENGSPFVDDTITMLGEPVIPSDFDFAVYPNPANQFLNITTGLIPGMVAELTLSSPDGKVLFEQYIDEQNYMLNLNSIEISTGIYFIRLNTKEKQFVQKVIIIR